MTREEYKIFRIGFYLCLAMLRLQVVHPGSVKLEKYWKAYLNE